MLCSCSSREGDGARLRAITIESRARGYQEHRHPRGAHSCPSWSNCGSSAPRPTR
ncbi:hypothetical protein [Lysobacter gummosus]|uniref:hypothetical protein n=1 Tax=Lysobacter gummosus TaxID=262324 RepID=UPI00362C35A3